MDGAPLKKDWVLTREALDGLLMRLDPDRERAAEIYEQIRQRLMKLFKWRGCLLFEEYADQTIDRVARRIAEGSEIETPNPYTLFHAVAMFVLKEHWRKAQKESEGLDLFSKSQNPIDDPEDVRTAAEQRKRRGAEITCLRQCLDHIPPESLALIKKYYAEGDVLNKVLRREVAGDLGISVNALRVRAFRIRAEVEKCVDSCLDTAGR